MQEDLCEDEELLNQSLWIDKMTHIKEASFDSLTRQTSPGESNSDPEEKYYMKIWRDMIDGVFDQMLRDAEGATSQKKLDDIKLDGNRTLADLQLLILSWNEKITRHIEVLMSNMTNMNEGSS